MSDSPPIFAVCAILILYFVFLLVICRREYRRLRHAGRTLNFRIVDIWAAILGLTPSLILIANLPTKEWLLLLFFVLAQLAGMFVAQADHLVSIANGADDSALISAGNVLLGALFYSVALLAGFVVAFLLLPASVIYLLGYGYGDMETRAKRKAPRIPARRSMASSPLKN